MKITITPHPAWPSRYVIQDEHGERLASSVDPRLAKWIQEMSSWPLTRADLDERPEFGEPLTGEVEVEL